MGPSSLPRREPSQLQRLAMQCQEDSKRWFPNLHADLAHHTLGMCGETGELANLVKKVEKGELSIADTATRNRLAEEAIDVFVYWCNIMAILRVDPQYVYDYKRAVNERRFGPNARKGS
jgi:NTP pyrophosphatase (non-canonical NTP hydrolase)